MVARMTIFLYGPPGSGKSSVGRLLADGLALPFYDLDSEIEVRSGKLIPEIFSAQGEAGFRAKERAEIRRILGLPESVVALGGGALLDEGTRAEVEAGGPILCLEASLQTLAERLAGDGNQRPLLAGDPLGRLAGLLAQREAHYASFPLRLDTSGSSAAEAAWQAQVCLGRFYVRGLGTGCLVRAQPGAADEPGEWLGERNLEGPVVVVSDENVAALYMPNILRSLAAGYASQAAILPAGEQNKTMAAVERLWEAFLSAGLERGSTVVALGGGVVSDLAGFAAATFLRGLRWAILPTTLLAMVDACLGGKTGADLPQGKNLVGAFHAPELVLADPQLLKTLPAVELRCGLAEVIKHAVIGEATLFERLKGVKAEDSPDWGEIVRRSMAVKIQVIQEDPLEKGRRAVLNFGHTIGHAVEAVSGFQVRHGEAVSIGMAAETRLAERIGMAGAGLAEEVTGLLEATGLPTEIPRELKPGALVQAIGVDKKRRGGVTRFSLPTRIGEVVYGVEIEEAALCDLFSSCTGQT
jgi:shikimate kinase/3-dehydroquinate synthase